MNFRKLFAAQLAVCVVCTNACYVFNNSNLWLPAVQAISLCVATFAIVQAVGRNRSIAIGSAVWVGLLSSASVLLSLSLRPNSVGFDAGIYDRGPLFLGLVCAALSLLFWKLLPWEPLEEENYESC